MKAEYDPKQAISKLKKLEAGLATKGARIGLVAAASPIKRGMKNNTPVDLGLLKSGIGHKALSVSAKARLGFGSSEAVIALGVTRKTGGKNRGYIANFLEKGTSTGIKPRPFLEPAFNNNISKSGQLFAKAIENFLRRLK